jgi:Resolvase, N terminal domain
MGRSLQDLVGFLSELHALKIDLFLRQQGLDTTTRAGKGLFQMMGVFAEFERAMIAERVRAGGRPPIAPALEKRIRGSWAVRCARHCPIVRSRSRDSAAHQPPFRRRKRRRRITSGVRNARAKRSVSFSPDPTAYSAARSAA